MIVEGFPNDEGASPQHMVKFSASVGGTPQDSEPYYAIRLSQNNGVDFVGGEPTDFDILDKFKAEGLTVKDLMGFYFLRKIPQW